MVIKMYKFYYLKQIITATASRYVEVIDGDGHKPNGWPLAFDDAKFESSPLIYDFDQDGIDDILIADFDGYIKVIKVNDNGNYEKDVQIRLPRLKVKKNWYEGLDVNRVDLSMSISDFHHYNQSGENKLLESERILVYPKEFFDV